MEKNGFYVYIYDVNVLVWLVLGATGMGFVFGFCSRRLLFIPHTFVLNQNSSYIYIYKKHIPATYIYSWDMLFGWL